MYEVYCDSLKIYDSRLEYLQIFNTQLQLELNKTGSFVFDIYPDHPYYDRLYKLKSIIRVYQDSYLIFQGRILNDEQGFYNQKQVACEGELAFLIDSIIRPYEFTGTPAEYLTKLITEHNAQVDENKQFIVGNITVTDGDTTNDDNQITRSDSDYKTTWDLITEKLVNSLGGYLWVRHEADGTYLDYLKDFDILSNQKIEFGKNLLDIKKTTKGEDIATAIIPVGGSGETMLNISSLPDGDITDDVVKKDDYVYSKSAVETYGWIFKVKTWSDTEVDAEHLQKNGVKELTESIDLLTTIELTSADLSTIEDVNPFRLGRYITVTSKAHGLDSTTDFLIKKLSLDILQPANNKLTVGAEVKTFTQTTIDNSKNNTFILERIDEVERNTASQSDIDTAMNNVIEQNTSDITQSSTEILTQVAHDYYLQEDADALINSVNTQFKQTNTEFELRFNDFSQSINDLANGTDAQFKQISKYIRFIDGNIVLGEEGNELTLKIQNDRISFLQSGLEVAYFSNRKLYVTDGEYTNSLQLGNFAFIPRANGNLSFKKVT